MQGKISARSVLPDFKVKKFLKLSIEMQEYYFDKYCALPARCDAYASIEEVEIGKIISLKRLFKSLENASIVEIIEIYHIMTDKNYKSIVRLRMYDIMMMFNFVTKGFEVINEKEKVLENKPDAKKVKAGIENLSKHSDLITLKELAKICNLQLYSKPIKILWFKIDLNTKPEDIPWVLAFSLLYCRSEESEFEKNYMKEIHKD